MDLEDSVTTGHEVSANLPALGIPNFNQAARIVRQPSIDPFAETR